MTSATKMIRNGGLLRPVSRLGDKDVRKIGNRSRTTMNTVLIEAHPLVRTGIAHLLRTLKGVTGVTVVEPDEGMFDAIETNADAGLLVLSLIHI